MTGLRNLVAVCVAALALGACTNLGAVRDFAHNAGEIAQYRSLTGDHAIQPIRQKRYEQPEQLDRLDREAAIRANQKPGLDALGIALVEYMDALGVLADDGTANYDISLDPLGRLAASTRFATQRQAEAVSGIAGLLIKAVREGWQRARVSALIAEGNAPVQTVCATLRDIAVRSYREDIMTEKDGAVSFFRRTARLSQDPAALAALDDLRERRLVELDARLAVVDSYVQALDKVADGHQKLFDARDDLDRKEIIATLRRYAKELRALGATLRPLLPI